MEERNITDIQIPQENIFKRIFGGTINGKNHPFLFIVRFGLTILEKFQKVIQYTIKIIILWIILLRILSCFLVNCTLLIICEKDERLKKVFVNTKNVARNLFTILLEKQSTVPTNATQW